MAGRSRLSGAVPSWGHRACLLPCVAWLAGVTAENNIPGGTGSSIGHKFVALEGCSPALPGARVGEGGEGDCVF